MNNPPGSTYNPYKLFIGLFIPNWLAERTEVSMSAKLCFGRLMQYAGRDGLCYPSVKTLSSEIGLGVRGTQKVLRELEEVGLICRVERRSAIGVNESNIYKFIWHDWMNESSHRVNTGTPPPLNTGTPPPLNGSSYKEDHKEENQLEEDIDHGVPNDIREKEGTQVSTRASKKKKQRQVSGPTPEGQKAKEVYDDYCQRIYPKWMGGKYHGIGGRDMKWLTDLFRSDSELTVVEVKRRLEEYVKEPDPFVAPAGRPVCRFSFDAFGDDEVRRRHEVRKRKVEFYDRQKRQQAEESGIPEVNKLF